MGPDRSNYEIWLIDYIDGSLDKEREALLLSFLDENPDLKEEMSDLAAISLIPGSGTTAIKESLKKVPSELSWQQFEMLCIAFSENDLKSYQKAELEEILTGNPERRKTFELYQKIRLVAPDEKFRYKNSLRRVTGSQKIFRYTIATISAAAAVVVMILVLRNPVVTSSGIEIAAVKRDEPVESEVIPAGKQLHEKIEPVIRRPGIQPVAENSIPVKSSSGPVSDNHLLFSVASKDSAVAEISRTEISKVTLSESSFTSIQPCTRLAGMNITPVSDEQDNEVKGPGQFIIKFFREKVIRQKYNSEKGSRNVYDIADAGINKLNKFFGWDMSLHESKNEKGEVKSVQFNSKLVRFSTPVKKGSL
jgi:hypothetical protein